MPQGVEPHLRGNKTTTRAQPRLAEYPGLALLHAGHGPALSAKLAASLLKGQQKQSQKRMAGHCAIGSPSQTVPAPLRYEAEPLFTTLSSGQ